MRQVIRLIFGGCAVLFVFLLPFMDRRKMDSIIWIAAIVLAAMSVFLCIGG